MAIKMVDALKRYFGDGQKYPEVTSRELLDLMKADKAGYHELAAGAAKELGEELLEPNAQ